MFDVLSLSTLAALAVGITLGFVGSASGVWAGHLLRAPAQRR
jgi:hypothetical protein